MVIKYKKIVVVILISVSIISIVVLGVFQLKNERAHTALTNGGDEVKLSEEEREYQLLRESILPETLEQMDSVGRRNAWLILNAMREVDFVENTVPGQSGISVVIGFLDLLDIGEIKETTVIRTEQTGQQFAEILVLRLTNEDGNIYYVWYHQTWALQMIAKDAEDGQIVYHSRIHTMIDGQIREREDSTGDGANNFLRSR